MANATRKIYEELKAAREERDGAAVIDNKTTAKLIRARLKAAFPGVKFSVRCSRGDAINISWENGPRDCEVSAITDAYSFGGFDGMIDLAYSSSNWLHPNGEMEHAASSGTEGSLGVVPSSATDQPKPQAILVKYGPKYVFTHREVGPELKLAAIRWLDREYGLNLPQAVLEDVNAWSGFGWLDKFDASLHELAWQVLEGKGRFQGETITL